MKTRYAKLAAVVLLIVGTIACNKETDMSGIDFSNIEDLYAQPLPVIQKAVQRKWKVARICGGVAGCVDYNNMFLTITETEVIMDDVSIGRHLVKPYSWQRKKIIDCSGKTFYTYILHYDDGSELTSAQIFECIKNDSLSIFSYSPDLNYSIFSWIYVNIK